MLVLKVIQKNPKGLKIEDFIFSKLQTILNHAFKNIIVVVVVITITVWRSAASRKEAPFP